MQQNAASDQGLHCLQTVQPFFSRICKSRNQTYLKLKLDFQYIVWEGVFSLQWVKLLLARLSSVVNQALLESAKGKNDHRNYFMISLQGNVAELGFKLTTPGSVVRQSIDCAMEPSTTTKY